jgi:UDP-N-acetylmuramoylalanine--D-glutamate ligase
MFERWRGAEREIAVVGLAKSGVAATRLLRREGVTVYASDIAEGPAMEAAVAPLRAAGATVELGGHDLERIARATAVVVSPGVPPEAPPLAIARHAHVPIVSEVDVGWAALSSASYAVITGTNGKTTTTALTAHLLQAAGLRAVAAGNIGEPLSGVAMAPPPPPAWVALEISSFQLHDTYELVPTVGLMTNLAPDHLDRYESLGDYYADKARLFLHAGASSCWVTNADDAEVQKMVSGIAGRHERFSLLGRSDGWYDRKARQLKFGDEVLLPRDQLQLLGDHNVSNALGAALAARRAGGTTKAIAEGLRTFRALPHRLEPVRTVNGVLWINDSKATNVASTTVALEAMDRPFVLLLGGRHKGQPYTGLASLLQGRCRGVIAYGEARELVKKDLDGVVAVVTGQSFEEVLEEARRLARPGDAVLLSPACSSYDMFTNYEERGARFRAAVEAM